MSPDTLADGARGVRNSGLGLVAAVVIAITAFAGPALAAPQSGDQQNCLNQLTKAGKVYLSRYGFPQPPARFDVVAIIWPQGREPIIRHTPSAFEATF